MDVALGDFAARAGVQLIYRTDITRGLKAKVVPPGLSPDEELKSLLEGTGLDVERINKYTLTIYRVSDLHGAGGTDGLASSLLMAQVNEQLSSREFASASAQSENTQATEDSTSNQNATKKQTEIETIVVTAQKREERLQDVPISISVLGGEALDSSTVRDVTEMLGRVPGVSSNAVFAGGTSSITIRGVGVLDGLNHGSATVGYYLDTIPFGFVKAALAPDPDTYDLERIEVLRGPQGTLYGASALNGVVRVLTKDANLDEFEFKARGSTSSTEDGGLNYRGDMAVNVPIIEGKLGARAVVGYQDWGGWIDKPQKKDANDAKRRNLRLKMGAQPTEQLSIDASIWISRDDSDQSNTGEESGANSSTNDEPSSADYDAYSLKVGYDFPWFSVASMTSYIDFSHGGTLDLSPFGLSGVDDIFHFEAQTLAEEVILNSLPGGSWRWSAGAMYRDSKNLRSDDVPGFFAALAAERMESKSYAVFGELTRIFLDGGLELTAGLRYFEDQVTQNEISRPDAAPPEQLVSKDATFDDLSKRFVLTWHPGKQTTFYASYAEGFRSGAHQNSAIILADQSYPSADPDNLKNYELGAKGSRLAGRLSYDAALYYIDWQDPQVSQLVRVVGLPFVGLVNSESASGIGVDLSLTLNPIDALEFGGYFSWNDLTLDDDVAALAASKGDRLPQSPEYRAGAWVDYIVPLIRSGFEGRLSVSADYHSKKLGGYGPLALSSDEITTGRASFSIRAPHNWTASLYVDNISNERGIPVASDGGQLTIRLRPRTIGLQFEYRY